MQHHNNTDICSQISSVHLQSGTARYDEQHPMGLQSITPPRRRSSALLCTALTLLASIHSPAQTPTIHAIAVPLLLPSAIVFDTTGNLYIAETGNHVIHKVDTQGHITTIAGTGTQGLSGDGGAATQAQLDSPQGLALTSTDLYIADTHNHRIRKLNLTTNLITTLAGTTQGFSGDSMVASQAQLNLPTALTIDANQNLYIADTANHRIRRIDATTGIITTVAGNGTQGDSGDQGPAPSAAIDSPQGIAVDTAGNLYLADTHNHRIRRIDTTTGIITTLAGTGTLGSPTDNIAASNTQLALPRGLTIDASGNLYLADTANHRIRRIDATTGIITTVAGTGTQGYSGDTGLATVATLDSPRSVTVASTSHVTLADTANQRVRQITATTGNPPTSTIQTIAGLGNTTPGTLTLSAPTVIAYGTGTLTATLATSTTATGSITLLDTYTSPTQTTPITSTLATLALVTNAASFGTTTLPAGTHAILATYPGDLTHASAQSTAFTLTITPAPTLTSLSTPISTTLPITFTASVASTTTGTPTGTLTLLDSTSTTPIATATLNSSLNATLLIPTLAPGTHSLVATYAGDTNFQPSTSTPSIITISTPVTTPADFTLASTGTTFQTIPSGTTATFNFTTQTQGTLSSSITLTATGLPPGAISTFNPTYLPPGQTSNTFTLTITPLKASTTRIQATLTLLILPIFWTRRRRTRKLQALLSTALLALLTLSSSGCGNRINTANTQTPTTPYTITVTATATSPTGITLTHTATVTLTVQ